jgi:flagellar biosynthesis/type III secretory pathway chaperone
MPDVPIRTEATAEHGRGGDRDRAADRHRATDRLAELIDGKQSVLVQLRELARQQLDLVDKGDMSRLLSLLAAKQALLNELTAVERDLDPFRDDDPAAREWRSSDARQRCRQTAEQCNLLLKEIVLLETQGESELTHRRDDVAARLQGVHQAAQAHHAYTAAPAVVHGPLDVSSES